MIRWWMILSAVLTLLIGGCTVERAAGSTAPPPAPAIISSALDAVDSQLPSTTSSYFINLNSVMFIECGGFTGTGSIIGRNTVITASHVVGEEKVCLVMGSPAVVTSNHPELDYAILTIGTTPVAERFPISCGGFVPGDTYYAIGFAGGRVFAVTKLVAAQKSESNYANGDNFNVRFLTGQSYRGMSGGPVIDDVGNQVGTVISVSTIGVHTTQSLELKDTSVCEDGRHK